MWQCIAVGYELRRRSTTAKALLCLGDVGYFKMMSGTFNFLKLRSLNWSVSALMVEGNDAWVGSVSDPKGAD